MDELKEESERFKIQKKAHKINMIKNLQTINISENAMKKRFGKISGGFDSISYQGKMSDNNLNFIKRNLDKEMTDEVKLATIMKFPF